MVIIDTTVWIDYFRGKNTPQTDWLDVEIDRQRLGLVDLILCEVLQGVRSPQQFETLRTELLRFEIFPTGGAELAVSAARNYLKLRSKGVTVRKTIDCWIATYCHLNQHQLLHNDRDFDPFERYLGLAVIHP